MSSAHFCCLSFCKAHNKSNGCYVCSCFSYLLFCYLNLIIWFEDQISQKGQKLCCLDGAKCLQEAKLWESLMPTFPRSMHRMRCCWSKGKPISVFLYVYKFLLSVLYPLFLWWCSIGEIMENESLERLDNPVSSRLLSHSLIGLPLKYYWLYPYINIPFYIWDYISMLTDAPWEDSSLYMNESKESSTSEKKLLPDLYDVDDLWVSKFISISLFICKIVQILYVWLTFL